MFGGLVFPFLDPSMIRFLPLFVFLYRLVVVSGVVANVTVIWFIVKRRLYNDPTYGYIVSLANAEIFKCVLLLLTSLPVLLELKLVIKSSFILFLLMLNDVPTHVSTLIFLLIAVDRYRFMRDPNKPRMSYSWWAIGSWLLAACLALPYPIYIICLDVLGYCNYQFKRTLDMLEYSTWLFIVMYFLPLSVTSFLHYRTSRKLKEQEQILYKKMYDDEQEEELLFANSPSKDNKGDIEAKRAAKYKLYKELENFYKQKRSQKYLIAMVTIFAICICPMMLVRVGMMLAPEKYYQPGQYIMYPLFVWVAYLPTCFTPGLFNEWRKE